MMRFNFFFVLAVVVIFSVLQLSQVETIDVQTIAGLILFALLMFSFMGMADTHVVKIWMHDSDGVDVCLSEVPDSTSISTITVGSKNAVMELTETQLNSVKTPLDEAATLREEARTAESSGDTDTAATKNTAAAAKETDAQNALNAL